MSEDRYRLLNETIAEIEKLFGPVTSDHRVRIEFAVGFVQGRLEKERVERTDELSKELTAIAATVGSETTALTLKTAETIRKAADDLQDFESSFNLRWDADMRAIKRWQAAHPGNDLVRPDHADLCVWLLEQLEKR